MIGSNACRVSRRFALRPRGRARTGGAAAPRCWWAVEGSRKRGGAGGSVPIDGDPRGDEDVAGCSISPSTPLPACGETELPRRIAVSGCFWGFVCGSGDYLDDHRLVSAPRARCDLPSREAGVPCEAPCSTRTAEGPRRPAAGCVSEALCESLHADGIGELGQSRPGKVLETVRSRRRWRASSGHDLIVQSSPGSYILRGMQRYRPLWLPSTALRFGKISMPPPALALMCQAQP